MSAIVYALYVEPFVISPPVLTASLVDALGCNLDWDSYSGPNFTSYKVYVDTTPGVDATSTLLGTILDAATSAWHDEAAPAGWTTRYYAVLLTADGQTAWSNEVTVTAPSATGAFFFSNYLIRRAR